MQFDIKYAYFNFLQSMHHPSIKKTDCDDLSIEKTGERSEDDEEEWAWINCLTGLKVDRKPFWLKKLDLSLSFLSLTWFAYS